MNNFRRSRRILLRHSSEFDIQQEFLNKVLQGLFHTGEKTAQTSSGRHTAGADAANTSPETEQGRVNRPCLVGAHQLRIPEATSELSLIPTFAGIVTNDGDIVTVA